MLKDGNFSNAEYIVKSWTIIVLAIIGLILAFSKSIITLYWLFTGQSFKSVSIVVENTFELMKYIFQQAYTPAEVKILSFFIWQSALPTMIFFSTKSFQSFILKRLKNKIIGLNPNRIIIKKPSLKVAICSTLMFFLNYIFRQTE